MKILVTTCLVVVAVGCARGPITSLDDAKFKSKLEGFTIAPVEYEPQEMSRLCGLAAITCLLKAWGILADQVSILKAHPPAKPDYGYSIGELKTIATAYGLKAYGMNSDIPFLESQLSAGRPLLIAVGDPETGEKERAIFHSVVVCGYGGDQMLIMDPGKGFLAVDRQVLDRAWSETDRACLLVAR